MHDLPRALALSPADRAAALTQVCGLVRSIPDFPAPGILFRDITPVLHDAAALDAAVRLHLDLIDDLHGQIDRIVGIESRGFLFGMAVAHALGAGFVPVRKPGKLPAPTVHQTYALEYGQDRLHMHADAVSPGDRVLIIDDLLATGGTAQAAAQLVEGLGGRVVACLFLIELAALGGRDRLGDRRVESVIVY
jgi:adenine phosphoribosyltransferase